MGTAILSQAFQFIISATYGMDGKEDEHNLLGVIAVALAGLNIAARPGAFLVDLMPTCETGH